MLRAQRILSPVAFLMLVCTGARGAEPGAAFLQMQGNWQPTPKGKSLTQTFQLTSDVASFGLTYDITIPKGTPPGKCSSDQWVFTANFVTLGMTSPTVANWYYQGFFEVRVDGVGIRDVPAEFRAIRTGGPDAMLEGTWATAKGPVHVRFLIRGNDDKLLMQVALGPKTQARKFEVELLAYPQGFGKPWNRWMFTATRDVAGPGTQALDAAKEAWALYYDKGMRGGPCGLVYVPDEVADARVKLGPYNVNTILTAKPGGRRVTMGLWDFTMFQDAKANRAYLRRHGGLVARDLASVARADWHTGSVPPTQLPKERAELFARLLKRRMQPTPYDVMTDAVVTPHIAWAKPYARGPVRTLVVAPRWMQRETVELAQRLDMQHETVCFSSATDVLTDWLYLYRSYDVYGYERKTAVTVLNMLHAKLRDQHDCLILSSFHPHIVPETLRRLIVEKVRAGTGLVLLGEATTLLTDLGKEVRPTTWSPAGVPVRTLPVLGRMLADKKRVWNAYTFGKGRVLALRYATGGKWGQLCLTPRLGHEDPYVLQYYDYFHSLVAGAVLWAARKEPPVRVRFAGAPGQVIVEADQAVPGAVLETLVDDAPRAWRRCTRTPVDLPKGTSTHTLADTGLATGPRYINVWVKKGGKVLGWGTTYTDPKADAPCIAALDIPNKVIRPGGTLRGTVRLSHAVKDAAVELTVWDTTGRLLRRRRVKPTGQTVPFEFTLGRPVAILHEVRAQLTRSGRLLDQRVGTATVPDPRVDDYHFLAWLETSNDAVAHHILRELAKAGVEWIDNYGLHAASQRQTDVYVRNAARYGLRSVPYATRIASRHGDGRVRRPCLSDPKHLKQWTAGLRERARGAAPYGPPGYTLGDENFLIDRQVDVCISPSCLAAFRRHLQTQYGSISRLNASWHTKLKAWSEAMPSTFEQVRKTPAHWPRWADHRAFMDRVFTRAHALGRQAIREVDPKARVGWDGIFSLTSWHGYDFYQLCRACDLLQVYVGHPHQVEYMRSWHRPDSILGAWYNGVGNADEISAKRVGWHLLFHGCNSSWYWMAYNTGPALVFPDLRPTPQLTWLSESVGEIKRGIGKLLLNARRENDRIAIHYSQASVHAGTLLGRGIAGPQWGFARVLEDLGLQYDMLAYEQIEQGALKDYKVLLMPACAALSPSETQAIRAFVERGGLVVADTVPGILDEHCRLLDRGRLDEVLGIARTGLPKPGGGAIRVHGGGLKMELAMPAYDSGVKAAGAEAWATTAKTPCVLVRKVGRGWAVVLNTPIETYERLRGKDTGRPVGRLMARLLDLVGVRPQVRITVGGARATVCETVRFTDGNICYVCIVKDNRVAGAETQEVTIRLPREAHVYDVRAKRALGVRQTVQAKLVPGDPKVYCLLPYAVQSVAVKPARTRIKAGDTMAFRVALNTGTPTLAGRHALRVDLLGPDGNVVRHYGRNVLTTGPTTEVSVELALNDSPGRWQVRVTDVATGRSATVPFHVDARP